MFRDLVVSKPLYGKINFLISSRFAMRTAKAVSHAVTRNVAMLFLNDYMSKDGSNP